MSKELAAWLLLIAAAATPATALRDGVQTAVTRVIAVLMETHANRGEPILATMPGGDRTRVGIRRIAAELFCSLGGRP